MFGFRVSQPPPVDVFYDAAPIALGEYEVRVHHTPGHCPGGVCLQIGKKGDPGRDLLVGDTLFAGSIGRTDLPGGDYAVLMRSITEVIFPLGDEAIAIRPERARAARAWDLPLSCELIENLRPPRFHQPETRPMALYRMLSW